MKVLEINVDSGTGSTGRIATDIAANLVEAGCEVVVAYGRDSVDRGISVVRIGTDLDVYCHAAAARIFDASGFGSRHATKKFIEWVREYDPDIIHLHNLHGYYINIEILFSYLKSCNKKIIWTLHDCWSFTGHCAHFTIDNCDQWKTECIKCSKFQKHTYPECILFSNAKSNFLRKKDLFTNIPNLNLVTPSEWLANLVKESFLNEYPLSVIHNGIDLNVFKPVSGNLRETYRLEDKKIILGVASFWNERKGLGDFLKLSKILDDKTKIVLIGLSDSQAQNLPANILCIKRTENIQQLVQWYTTSDLVFNPTYEDSYPTVNLEAQACGTPVVTYNTGGSPESVPKENVIPFGEVEKLIPLIQSRPVIKAMDFSKKCMIGQYLELYDIQ